MRTTKHPESLKEVNAIKITQEVRDFAINLAKEIDEEKTNRSDWEIKIDKLTKLRFGYREKKAYPWPKCANYSIPLIDSHIYSIKPAYINLAYGISPICTFEPFGGEDIENAGKKEVLFDWRMRTKVKFFNDYVIGTDKMLGQGVVVFKIVWEYTTRTYTDFFDIEDLGDETKKALDDERVTNEMLQKILIEELGIDDEFEENIDEMKRVIEEFRSGETEFELTLVEIEHNRPQVSARDVREDLVIPTDTTDLQYARFIQDNLWKMANEIKKDMRDEKYETYDNDAIEKWATDKEKPSSKHTDQLILLHPVCCWYDINDDGIKERCIITYPENNPEDVLRFIEIPYDHGKFPYEDVRRELIDAGIYKSRSICELDEDYQVGITQAVNQAEDNGTIVNRPVIVTRRGAVTNIKNRSYVPGETVETTGSPDDYQIRQTTNISQPALFQFAQYLKAWADQRLGNITAASSDPTNLPGQAQGGKKTAKEITMLEGLQGKVEALDLIIFQMQMARIYDQIDALYDQYGDEEEEVLTTGEKPIKVNRREIQGKRDIVPNGRLDNTNPQLRAQKSFNLMKMFIGDADIKQYELKKLFLIDYDHRIAKKILYTQEEKAQMEEQRNNALKQMRDKAISEGIDLKQIDIMLEVYKETLLMPVEVEKAKKLAPIEGKPHSTKD